MTSIPFGSWADLCQNQNFARGGSPSRLAPSAGSGPRLRTTVSPAVAKNETHREVSVSFWSDFIIGNHDQNKVTKSTKRQKNNEIRQAC